MYSVNLNQKINHEIFARVSDINELSELSDIIAANLTISTEDKQQILSEFDSKVRLEKLISCLAKEIEILNLEKNISAKVKQQIDKVQKEYYLKEQMKAIQDELGDKDGIAGEIAEAIHQRGLACPDGLYLRSGKDDAGLECFQELKVEGCSPVFDLYVALCLWHISLCCSSV